MTEDRFRLPHLWRRMVLIGLVLVAGPAMAWSAIWITRAYVVPSRVAVHRPAIATPAQTPAPLERTAPPASAAGDPLYKLAMAGNEPLQASASAAQAETTASIAPPENVPLPRPKPRITVAAIAGPVPLPRARPQRPE
jgi:hypothetical protein